MIRIIHNRHSIFFLHTLIVLLLLSGCGTPPYEKQITNEYSRVEKNLLTLKQQLHNKQLTNSQIVAVYADKLTRLKPDFKPVAEAMMNDATEKGTLYQGLVQRLQQVNRHPENKQQFESAMQSLISINTGANPQVFNEALIDLINTMAELSGGELATVSIPKDSQANQVRSESITPGSYLVGNPQYGEYRQDSSGQSFWQWYGQYSFFKNLGGNHFRHTPIQYSEWNSRPRYSYYNDYGRDNYGNRADREQAQQRNEIMRNKGLTPAKPKKQYGSALGSKRISTYTSPSALSKSTKSQKVGSGEGPRHVDKVVKRSSGFLGGQIQSKPAKSNAASNKSAKFKGYSSKPKPRHSSSRRRSSRK